VFEPLSAGRPPDRGFEHVTEIEEGSNHVITTPYRHLKRLKDEIEKDIKESLEMGHIRPSFSPLTSSFVMVKKKHGTIVGNIIERGGESIM
jgi:hypothetical protein